LPPPSRFQPDFDREAAARAARTAAEQGYSPIPLLPLLKRPAVPDWRRSLHETPEAAYEAFLAWQKDREGEGPLGVGILLGTPSGGLVDIDLDHPRTRRFAPMFLPDTPMAHGRASSQRSHAWYVVEGKAPASKKFLMPDSSTSVEIRSTGGQTAVPPSIHPSGEPYEWSGSPWGPPARIKPGLLVARVATLALASVLGAEGVWPQRGGRHDAYLALAGALLRHGEGIHPMWEQTLPGLIKAFAEVTGDEDGPETRASEVISSTLARLREGRPAHGWPTLERIIGEEATRLARDYSRLIETALGFARQVSEESVLGVEVTPLPGDVELATPEERAAHLASIPLEDRNPMAERLSSWEALDLDPYLFTDRGLDRPLPGLLFREDGLALLYPGLVNMLVGRPESGKTWAALVASKEVVESGRSVVYVDFEADPVSVVGRMVALGVERSDLAQRFHYLQPDQPLATMMTDRYGRPSPTEGGRLHETTFGSVLDSTDPALVVLDGTTILLGIHHADPNDTGSVERMMTWVKGLTRAGRTAVLILDHTTKAAPRGSMPLGSQHKVAAVGGLLAQVFQISRVRPGAVGHLEVLVIKDRPGGVRENSPDGDPQVAADLYLDALGGADNVLASLKPPNPSAVVIGASDSASARLSQTSADAEAILAALEATDVPMSRAEIKAAVPGVMTDSRFKEASRSLLAQGLVRMTGGGAGSRWVLVGD
jgi:hypothetical protein